MSGVFRVPFRQPRITRVALTASGGQSFFGSASLDGVTTTPDNVALVLDIESSASLDAVTMTPDNANLSIANSIESAAVAAAVTTTPDNVSIVLDIESAAVLAAVTTTPDNISLGFSVESAATLSAVTTTPDTILMRDGLDWRLRFYGTASGQIDRVRIPLDVGGSSTTADVGSGDFTYEFWINCLYANNTATDPTDVRDSNIFFDRDIWGHVRGHVAGVTRLSAQSGDLLVCFGVAGAGLTWNTIYGTTDVGDGLWHHVAIDRNSSTGLIRLFVDGNLDASDTYTTGDLSYPDGHDPGSGQDNEYIVLGTEKHDLGSGYNGFIDEIRISDNRRYTGSSLTPPSAPFSVDVNTAALYDFDDGAGTTLVDQAGTANGELLVGGASNGPTWEAGTLFANHESSATLAAVTTTPDSVEITLSVESLSSSDGATTTPDNITITLDIESSAALEAVTTTPDNVTLLHSLEGLAVLSGITTTPDNTNLILDILSSVTLDGVTTTPDNVAVVLDIESVSSLDAITTTSDDADLSLSGVIESSAVSSMVTTTPDNVSIVLDIESSSLADAITTTPDVATLGLGLLSSALSSMATATPDNANLSISFTSLAVVSMVTATPDNASVVLSISKTSVSSAIVTTPDNIVLTMIIASAVSVSMVTTTSDGANLVISGIEGIVSVSFSASKPAMTVTARSPSISV